MNLAAIALVPGESPVERRVGRAGGLELEPACPAHAALDRTLARHERNRR